VQIDSAMGHWYSARKAKRIIFDARTRHLENILKQHDHYDFSHFSRFFHHHDSSDFSGFSCFQEFHLVFIK